MRRLLFATLLAVVVSSNVGCFLPIYSAEPERRTRQLIDTSENLRLLLDEWERFWFWTNQIINHHSGRTAVLSNTDLTASLPLTGG